MAFFYTRLLTGRLSRFPGNFAFGILGFCNSALTRPSELQGKAAAGVAQVEAGEMLFLPAGWFHEVTSQGGAARGGHLALNYVSPCSARVIPSVLVFWGVLFLIH